MQDYPAKTVSLLSGMPKNDLHDVVIIGAGTTGAAAAYHLSQAGICDVLCLDMGRPGRGRSAAATVPRDTPLLPGEEPTYEPGHSGSAVFEGGEKGPRTIKMIVTLPPYLKLEGFADLFGWEGVKNYLELAIRGRDLQLELASRLLPNPAVQVKQMGSLMVCGSESVEELKKEFAHLRQLDCDCEWWGQDQVVAAHGEAANFTAGIWFAKDARIDSVSYAQALLDAAASTGSLTLRVHCPAMVGIQEVEKDHPVQIHLVDGTVLCCKKAIVATGGFFMDDNLAGLLTPRYSYLAALTHGSPSEGLGMASPDSPNFFTYGFSHDWCVEDSFVRISGEDHYSALKSPRAKERCRRLAEWIWKNYPYLEPQSHYPAKYGVYSETADHMPLVGIPSEASHVCYLVGCNAWGQASLSAAAAMAPALLGYRELAEQEKAVLKLFSIRRFSGKGLMRPT
jgi:glycine/D-amino acid oxidase-like deaminating enzyme